MARHYVPSPMYETISSLGCCGCGNPEETYKAIHEMLLYFSDFNNREKYKKIQDGLIGDDVDPYVQFMAYVLDNKGFLEHGSSIGGSWLTAKGKMLLECMTTFEKYNYETDDIPESVKYVEKTSK